MMRNKKSTNYSISRELKSKLRRYDLPFEMDYIIIYTFLYKYCSDHIKDHLLLELTDKELTIDEAFSNEQYLETLSYDILRLYGYHIKKSDAFIDEVINNHYSKKVFLHAFLEIFPQNIIFNSEYNDKQYFDEVFARISEIDLRKFDSETTQNIGDIIHLISRLDIFDDVFKFDDVLSVISSSRLMHVESNPEYINQVLSTIALTQKKTIRSAYDPFMKNGDLLINLNENLEFGLKYSYGKDAKSINYLYAIAKLFIRNFHFNNVFLRQENATDSVDINGASFDAIVSSIPISIKNYQSSKFNQNLEISKRNRSSEVKNILFKELGIDMSSLNQDVELNLAVENLVEKIGFENDSNDLVGEYESLKDSEFLFLINLVDSLNDDGIMVISISENFLFKDSLETLRKYLTFHKNYVDTIIRLPNESYRSRPEVVMVFRKNKLERDILFIDMSGDYDTQKSGLIYSGSFRKNLILDDKTISKMENVFLNKLTISKYSNLISIDEIIDNRFNLSVSRYVDTFEGEFISLDNLVSEKQDIDSNIKKLNLKIEKMMDELDIRF